MKNLLRSLSLAAFLVLGGGLLLTPLAPAHAQGLGESLSPNEQAYADGVASAETYLSVPRSAEEIGAEINLAYYLQSQGTTLREFYYMQGYIDRLGQS